MRKSESFDFWRFWSNKASYTSWYNCFIIMSLFLLFEDSSAESLLSNATDSDFENACSSSGDGEENNCEKSSTSQLHAKIAIKNEEKISCAGKIAWGFVLTIMTLFFLAAAYVQHNDPDPFIWMPVYLVPCFVNLALLVSTDPNSKSASTPFWKCVNWIINIHICYCYALGFWTLTHYIHRQIWDDERGKLVTEMVSEPDMQAEEAKELIGLCLVVAWLSFVSNGNCFKFGLKGLLFGCALTALPIVSWVIVEKLEGDRDQACF